MTAFITLLEKEILRFMKVLVQTIMTPIINSTLYLLIFGVSLGASIKLENDMPYLAFLIPGLIMMSALNNAYQNSASSIVGSKFHGDLMDLRTMPLTSQSIVWAMSLGGLFRGLFVGFLTFIVSEVFYYAVQGKFLSIQNPFLLLLYLVIGGLSFAMLGIAVGFRSKNFEQVNAISSFVLVPLLYLGGVFFSLDHVHPFWQKISQLNPLLYFINGVRYSIVGVSDISWQTSLCVGLVFFAILFRIAVVCVVKGNYQRW